MTNHTVPSRMISCLEYLGTRGMKIRVCHRSGIFNPGIPVFSIALHLILARYLRRYCAGGTQGDLEGTILLTGFSGRSETGYTRIRTWMNSGRRRMSPD